MNAFRRISRDVLWSLYLGGLSLALSAPLVGHAFGPAIAALFGPPGWIGWNALLTGSTLALAGAAVVAGLGRLVALPPRVAAAGVGVAGPLLLALLAYLGQGWRGVWPNGPAGLLRIALATLGGFAAARIARALERRARAPKPVGPSASASGSAPSA